MVAQATTPAQKLDLSRRCLQYLKKMQERPNLSPKAKKRLPGLIEMQEIAVRLRERAITASASAGPALGPRGRRQG